MSIWQFNNYESVFIEDDHYLYAYREPFGWAHNFAVNEYHETRNLHGEREWIRWDTSGTDYEYMAKLDPAPRDVAREILRIEARITARANLDDPYEQDAYVHYKNIEIDDWSRRD